MSQLKSLRSQLASLRRSRQFVRLSTAWSSFFAALFWILAVVFVLDFAFELDVVQRAVVVLVAVAAVCLAYTRFTQPMLGVTESDLDMALLVERNQNINSDLVAALQFERPEAADWGSRQLEEAVIHDVGRFSRGLNVFDGFSREQMLRRGALLVATLLLIGGLASQFPVHARVFLDRLMLGTLHYPSDTVIQQVVVNRQAVLLRGDMGSQPYSVKSPQGQPVSFAILCTGELPDDGTVKLASSTGLKRDVELRRLSIDERAANLKQTLTEMQTAAGDPTVDISAPWRERIAASLRFDAAAAAEAVHTSNDDRSQVAAACDLLATRLENWPGTAEDQAVYAGNLPRLIDRVDYNVYVGDAWTDAATVGMIPLPEIQPNLQITPPRYAATLKQEEVKPGTRQVSVLEGSRVDVSIGCTNEKPLEEAWLIVRHQDGVQKYDLTATDDDRRNWSLTTAQTLGREVKALLQRQTAIAASSSDLADTIAQAMPPAVVDDPEPADVEPTEKEPKDGASADSGSDPVSIDSDPESTDSESPKTGAADGSPANDASETDDPAETVPSPPPAEPTFTPSQRQQVVKQLAELGRAQQTVAEKAGTLAKDHAQGIVIERLATAAELAARAAELTSLAQFQDAQALRAELLESLQSAAALADPFSFVQGETRFEIQVTDEDNLHLESPLKCYLRLRTDRLPTVVAGVVHKVIVPDATPNIEFRLQDDHGISKLLLHYEVVRGEILDDGDTKPDPTPLAVYEPASRNSKLPPQRVELPLLKASLPFSSRATATLSHLDLRKGDRLRLMVEAVDFRGDLPGRSSFSESIVLDVTDESGVLAAIAEADERSEQRLTDIIKQQLGIGESP